MNGASLHKLRMAILSALGATVLLGTPLLAQADQGKWWTPKEGDRRAERRDRESGRDEGNRGWSGRSQGDRWTWRDPSADRGAWGNRGAWGDRGFGRSSVTWRDRRYSGRGSWGGYSSWRGVPVRRDFLVIRDHRYGGYFRARRFYCAPRYWGRFVYVRPVRYFIAADALIGGVGIHARILRPHYLYGCNFCDARFDTYDAYAAHVSHCSHRPGGFSIAVSNWDGDYDSSWDGPYQVDGYDPYYDSGDYNYDDHCDYDN